jgi:hypothetical protein
MPTRRSSHQKTTKTSHVLANGTKETSNVLYLFTLTVYCLKKSSNEQ